MKRSPSQSPIAARVAELRGEAWALRGDEERTRRALEEALGATHDPGRRAALRLAIAELDVAAGRMREARTHLVTIWIEAAASPEAAAAATQLGALEARAALPPRSAEEWTRRGSSLARAAAHRPAAPPPTTTTSSRASTVQRATRSRSAASTMRIDCSISSMRTR